VLPLATSIQRRYGTSENWKALEVAEQLIFNCWGGEDVGIHLVRRGKKKNSFAMFCCLLCISDLNVGLNILQCHADCGS